MIKRCTISQWYDDKELYENLRSWAHARLASEPLRVDIHLDPTALPHTVYPDLVKYLGTRPLSRGEAFAIATAAMRQKLIDYGRGDNALKRGGGWKRRKLEDYLNVVAAGGIGSDDIVELWDLFDHLKKLDFDLWATLYLRFFEELSIKDIATLRELALATVVKQLQDGLAKLRQICGTGE